VICLDEGELSQILKEAFRLYSYDLPSGVLAKPFKLLLQDKPAVVEISLRRNRLVVDEFDLDGQEAEIANLKRKIVEKETEIQSLTLLLEKQKQKASDGVPDDSPPYYPEAEQEKPKSKRNRKQAEVDT
jgi:hypothetical protein